MKKRVLCVVMVLLMVILLCSCAREDPLQAQYTFRVKQLGGVDPTVSVTVDNTTPYKKLITKDVDIHYFMQTYTEGPYDCNGYGDLGHIAKDIGVECLRETEAGALYSVHTVKQGGLLYIFYQTRDYYSDMPLTESPMRRWFYVREPLSSADYEGLDTIDEVIEKDASAQIFKNTYYSCDAQSWEVMGGLPAWHYLSDGILEVGYKEVDGELVMFAKELCNDLDLRDFGESERTLYNARILDMDWVK